MALASMGLWPMPLVGTSILLSAADRGLNYSLQQAAKETLYVPLTDAQKYKGKAFHRHVRRSARQSLSAITLIVVNAAAGISIRLRSASRWPPSGRGSVFADRLGRSARRPRGPAPGARRFERDRGGQSSWIPKGQPDVAASRGNYLS
jgi:hypothetical protein